MRRRVPIALLIALAAAGCGGDDSGGAPARSVPARTPTQPASELADPAPTKAARDARPDRALAARLQDGAVAVVDRVGRMGIRPSQIDFAHGGRLYGLKWRRWGDHGAEGSGTMAGVVCEPSCGNGRLLRAPARIRLSEPVACPRGRFFDRARIDVVSDDPHADSTSWLAAPC
jgi:hypothetical protein